MNSNIYVHVVYHIVNWTVFNFNVMFILSLLIKYAIKIKEHIVAKMTLSVAPSHRKHWRHFCRVGRDCLGQNDTWLTRFGPHIHRSNRVGTIDSMWQVLFCFSMHNPHEHGQHGYCFNQRCHVFASGPMSKPRGFLGFALVSTLRHQEMPG